MPTVAKLTQRLADDLVKSAPPGKWGEQNSKLKLKIYPSRLASWVYRHSGREHVIGAWPQIDLKAASAVAAQMELEQRSGDNPIDKRRVARSSLSDGQLTLRYVYELYNSKELHRKSAAHAKNWQSEWENFLLPKIGDQLFFKISRQTIIDLIAPHRELRPSTANRMVAGISRLYNWLSNQPRYALYWDDRDINPARKIEKERVKERNAYLTPAETQEIWYACDALPNPYTAALVRMLLITGKRTTEARHMRHDQIDKDKRIWTIPNPKSGEFEEKVPLTDRAFKLIQELQRSNGPYVFSLNGGLTPVQTDNNLKKKLQKLSGVYGERWGKNGWVFHDFRRSLKTGVSELGCHPHISELILGHRLKGVEKVYNKAQLLKDKRHWLERWEAEVLGS